MVISLVYYAVSYSAGTFGGNRYLVFFLTSLIEIPSNWTCIVLCKKYVIVSNKRTLAKFGASKYKKQDQPQQTGLPHKLS